MESKRCGRCKEVKITTEFYRNKSTSDGFSQMCQRCCASYYAERRARVVEAQVADLPPNPKLEAFAQWVFRMRGQLGLTQEALGKIFGIGGSQVRLWEKGQSLPRQPILQRMETVFGEPAPLSTLRSKHGHIPSSIQPCAHCGKLFPVYKINVRHCSKLCSLATFDQTGEKNPAWKGGQFSTRWGYTQIKRPDHPAAYKNGYVMEHRVVMEEILGRYLKPEERVHHRNGRRGDNRPENLELWTVNHKDPAGIRVSDLAHCPTCTCSTPPKPIVRTPLVLRTPLP